MRSLPIKLKAKPGIVAAAGLCTLLLCGASFLAEASNHYTARQMEALAARVGLTFWAQSVNGKGAYFSVAPSANAKRFQVDKVVSFQILEVVGQAAKNPYYKVAFDNGQEAYLSPEQFIEAFNLSILTTDPSAEEKKKAAAAETAEKNRVEWIRAQPWSAAVKEAAIKKQPVIGLNTGEATTVLGAPSKVTKVRGAITVAEEHWLYPDGSLLIFHNGLLSKVDKQSKK